MNKFIAASAAFVLSTALAAPAFADTLLTTTVDTQVAASADLTCMGTAVDAREGAVLQARTEFNAKVLAAMTTRRASLQAAFTIGNNSERKVAIKAALDVYVRAVVDARTQYRAAVKAAHQTFTAAIKQCKTDASVRITAEAGTDRTLLNLLKKQVSNAFSAHGNASSSADVSL